MERLMKTQIQSKVCSWSVICLITIVFLLITFIPGPLLAGNIANTQCIGHEPQKTLEVGDPLSAGGGEFREYWRFLSLGGLIPLDFTLIYAPDLQLKSPVNDGRTQFPPWEIVSSFTSNTIKRIVEFEDQNVTPAQAYINVFLSDDSLLFKDDGTGTFLPMGPGRHQIKRNGTYYYLMDPFKDRVYIFRNRAVNWNISAWNQFFRRVGEVVYVMDRNNNMLSYTYNEDNLPTHIEDGLGRQLDLDYIQSSDIEERHLSAVSDGCGRTLTFDYQELTCNGQQRDVLSSFTDAMNRTTSFDYYDQVNTDCNLIQMINRPLGNSHIDQDWTKNPKGVDAVNSQRDAYGNETTLSWTSDANDNLITTVNYPDGTQRIFHHKMERYPLDLTDPSGNTITTSYNADDQMASLTNRLGDTTSFTYHEETGKIASIRDAKGDITNYIYTAQDQTFTNPDNSETVTFTFYNLTRIDYPDGTNEQSTYDANGNMLTHVDQAGKTWTYAYNTRGQVLTSTNPTGGVTTYAYDTNGNLSTKKDHFNNTTSFGYDTMMRITKLTRPDATFRSFTYDNNNNILTVTDEGGKVTTYDYDNNNNLKTITDPLNNIITMAYDGNDRLISVVDRLNKTSTLTYDELGRLKTINNPVNETITNGYNAHGWLTSITDPGDKTTNKTYDKEGVISSLTDPLANTWNYTTDKLGKVIRITSPLSNTHNYTRDSMERIISYANPLSQTTTYTWDSRGLLTGTTLPEGISASYVRNDLGRITQITDPNGNAWNRTYDQMGRLTSRTDPLSNTISYSYDSRNRLSAVTFPESTLDITCDEVGNVTRKFYSDNTDLQYTYDDNNRLLTANGLSLNYDARGGIRGCNGLTITRDDAGRIASVNLASGKIVTYTYNSRGLVSRVSDWVGGTTDITYDDAGRLASLARPNGVTTTHTYDDDGRLIGITEKKSGTLSSIALTRDGEGNITTAIRDIPLIPDLTTGTQTFTYNAASHVSDFTYDKMGRLTADGSRTYSWDLASRLTSYTEEGNTTTFTYDGRGMSVSRTSNGTTQKYVLNYALGLPSISVVSQGGSDLRYYIHLPNGWLLHSIDAAYDTRCFYHFDEMGTTLFLTDDSGVITDNYGITPYGKVTAASGSTENPFTFLGAYGVMQEGNTGLYYMRARYYDCESGKFLSRDPVKSLHPMQVNPYLFAECNPTRNIDPLGLKPFSLMYNQELMEEYEKFLEKLHYLKSRKSDYHFAGWGDTRAVITSYVEDQIKEITDLFVKRKLYGGMSDPLLMREYERVSRFAVDWPVGTLVFDRALGVILHELGRRGIYPLDFDDDDTESECGKKFKAGTTPSEWGGGADLIL